MKRRERMNARPSDLLKSADRRSEMPAVAAPEAYGVSPPESFDRIVYHDATWQSWVNQDKCMIGRHRNLELFKRTDMYIWHGIASSTEKKLAKHVRAWQDKGYAFTYKVFPNMGHGTLAGEHPQQFSKEVQAAHRRSLQKEKP